MTNYCIVLNEEEVKEIDWAERLKNEVQNHYGSGAKIKQIILIISND